MAPFSDSRNLCTQRTPPQPPTVPFGTSSSVHPLIILPPSLFVTFLPPSLLWVPSSRPSLRHLPPSLLWVPSSRSSFRSLLPSLPAEYTPSAGSNGRALRGAPNGALLGPRAAIGYPSPCTLPLVCFSLYASLSKFSL